MRKVFLSNLVLLVVLNLLIKPFYIFAIDRNVQNAVGAEEYGLFFALFNFAYLFQMVHDFGLQNFNHVHFSKVPRLHEKYLPKILAAKSILALLYFITVMLVAFVMGYDHVTRPLLVLITLNFVLASVAILLRTSLSAQGFYRLDSLLSVLDKLIMIIVVGALLWYLNLSESFRIEWFVYAQSLAFTLTLLTGAFLLARHNRGRIFRLNLDKVFSIWLMKKAFPFALILLLMSLYTRMDAVMLERMLEDGAYQAGVYAASYRILDAANMAGVLIAGLLLPMIAKLLAAKEGVEDLANLGMRILWIVATLVATISWVFAEEIVGLLYIEANQEWADVFRILMLSYVATCMAYVYGTLLTAAEKLRSLNLTFLGGVVLNFFCNLELIPFYGAWGSAVATLITQSVVTLSLFWLCINRIPLKRQGQAWGRPLIFLLSLVAATYFLLQVDLNWIASAVLVGLSGIILALALGVLHPRVIKELLVQD